MRELSLFSGAGGGLLGSKLLGWTTVGYVEYEEYCQKVLRQRIADGILDAAPIFGDIRKFISEGYADAYQGMVDVVTGGFPCQPFSLAGKGFGEFDPRNMWPQTIEVIRRVRPRFALLENVPGLLANKYMGRVFGDLAATGYNYKWLCISAQSQGAPIERERIFIAVADKGYGEAWMGGVKDWPSQIWKTTDRKCPEFWVQAPSRDTRVVNGMAEYMDRVSAIGNGQVPLCMAYAFQKLFEGIIE